MGNATNAFLGEMIKESTGISLLPRTKYEFYNLEDIP